MFMSAVQFPYRGSHRKKPFLFKLVCTVDSSVQVDFAPHPTPHTHTHTLTDTHISCICVCPCTHTTRWRATEHLPRNTAVACEFVRPSSGKKSQGLMVTQRKTPQGRARGERDGRIPHPTDHSTEGWSPDRLNLSLERCP